MSDLDITATITRATGGPLAIEDPNVYRVIAFGPGGRTWRRDTVSGRYQHGRALLNAVLESGTALMQVRVYGATWVEVCNRAQAMVDAFSQMTYVLTVTIEGATTSLACEAADITLMGGDVFQKHHAMAGMQEFQLVIPRDPQPIAGIL